MEGTTTMFKTIRALVLAVAAALAPSLAHAAEITYDDMVSVEGRPFEHTTWMATMSITGDIVPGDDAKFAAFVSHLEAKPMLRITLNSRGGNVQAAMRIAEMITERDGTTEVGPYDECYSACFFMLAAGKERLLDPTAQVGVHQAALRGYAQLGVTLSLAKQMRAWDVPPEITDAMLATPPGQIYRLNRTELREVDTGRMACRRWHEGRCWGD
jgi:hypothetical protein